MRRAGWLPILAVSLVAIVLGWSTPARTEEPKGGKHPQINAAMRQLEQAEKHLDKAGAELGGHRVRALELVKQAQAELRQGLAAESAGGTTSGGTAAKSAPAGTKK